MNNDDEDDDHDHAAADARDDADADLDGKEENTPEKDGEPLMKFWWWRCWCSCS